VADELNCKIFSIRDKFDNFDKTFTFIYDYICEKHPELQNKRRMINIFLHYMYVYCDYGKKTEEEMNAATD